jgi:catechol 2,3-dioxygenase-like lactoylglutathione lyase family enzyme
MAAAKTHLSLNVRDVERSAQWYEAFFAVAAKERLEQAGLVTFSEENVTCCYAKQDKIWVRDPDGNAWEVYALLDDMEDEDEHHEHGESSCCIPAAGSAYCS